MDNADDDFTEQLLDATTALLPPLLAGLSALAEAGRRLHPPTVSTLAHQLRELQAPLAEGRSLFEAVAWPEHLVGFRDCGMEAARLTSRGLSEFSQSPGKQQPIMGAYKSLGYLSQGLDALYPLTRMLPPVSRFYLDPDCVVARQNLPAGDAAVDALAEALSVAPEQPHTGVIHAGNAKNERGGFSLYVPEDYDESTPAPMIIALHGGSGHGRSFLWSWLSAARSCGALLMAPTSVGNTWSLGEPELDSQRLLAMLEFVRERYALRDDRLLLTGMSDGGTFSYLAGYSADAPYTHMAPMAASFHPLILQALDAQRVRDVPIFLMHGALDWMFDVGVARTAKGALESAGAAIEYREFADLSHTFPRGELGELVQWFLT